MASTMFDNFRNEIHNATDEGNIVRRLLNALFDGEISKQEYDFLFEQFAHKFIYPYRDAKYLV